MEGWEKHGQGTFTYGKGKWEGDKFVGEFKDGIKHCPGTFTFSDGSKYVVEWRRDKPWKVKFYDKKGNILIKIANGVLQK